MVKVLNFNDNERGKKKETRTALQLEQGIDVSASQRDFRFLQKSQLRLALVRFNRCC